MNLPNQVLHHFYKESFMERVYRDIKAEEDKKNNNGEAGNNNVIDPNIPLDELEEILEDAGL